MTGWGPHRTTVPASAYVPTAPEDPWLTEARAELAVLGFSVVTRCRGPHWIAFACDRFRPVEDVAENSPITAGPNEIEAVMRLRLRLLSLRANEDRARRTPSGPLPDALVRLPAAATGDAERSVDDRRAA